LRNPADEASGLIHLDKTLDLLEPTAEWEEGESSEAFPSGR
jgi:hypothetical protein